MLAAIYLAFLDNEEEVRHFEDIYTRNYNKMLWKAKSILIDEALSEDVVQDAFLRILKNKSKYFSKSREEIDGLCVLMVKHMSLNRIRDMKHEVSVDLEEDEKEGLLNKEEEGKADLLNALIEKEDAKTIHDLINMLPEKYSTVLTLFYGMQYSCNEIASMLGINTHTVEVQLSRGRKKLESILEEHGYGR